MLVKVLIKRRLKDPKARTAFTLIRKIRARAMNQPGYISGETLVDYRDPQKVLVFATWQSMDDWMKWKDSGDRNELEKKLEEFLESSAEYEAYVYSKYYLSVSGDRSDPQLAP